MSEFEGFNLAFRGYNCNEVDEFVTASIKTEGELRESCSELQKKYDELLVENTRLAQENERITADCATLAISLKKLRDEGGASIDDGYKEKYEAAMLEIERLKNEKHSSESEENVECGEVASQMVAEVAEVVKKLERDARRKAEAITLSAKLEQAQAQLIKTRVNEEVKSLVDMLNSYLSEHPDTAE